MEKEKSFKIDLSNYLEDVNNNINAKKRLTTESREKINALSYIIMSLDIENINNVINKLNSYVKNFVFYDISNLIFKKKDFTDKELIILINNQDITYFKIKKPHLFVNKYLNNIINLEKNNLINNKNIIEEKNNILNMRNIIKNKLFDKIDNLLIKNLENNEFKHNFFYTLEEFNYNIEETKKILEICNIKLSNFIRHSLRQNNFTKFIKSSLFVEYFEEIKNDNDKKKYEGLKKELKKEIKVLLYSLALNYKCGYIVKNNINDFPEKNTQGTAIAFLELFRVCNENNDMILNNIFDLLKNDLNILYGFEENTELNFFVYNLYNKYSNKITKQSSEFYFKFKIKTEKELLLNNLNKEGINEKKLKYNKI